MKFESMTVKKLIPDMIERMKNLKADDQHIGDFPIYFDDKTNANLVSITSTRQYIELIKDVIVDFERNKCVFDEL